jgi:uncharacterized protein
MLTLRLAALLLLQGIAIPQPVGYVNDFARIIDPATAARINAIIADVKAKSGGEIVVVTLADIKDRDVADVARTIGRDWKVGAAGKIGDRARNAGTIILIVPKETNADGRGRFRIETGQGSEGFITDGTAGAIRDEVIPFFQRGDYAGGIEVATSRVAQRYAGEFAFTLDPSSQVAERPVRRPSRRTSGVNPAVLLVLFIIVLSMMGKGRRRGGCLPLFIPIGGGGFGHGGFRGGFGGGGFGGGGGGGFGGFGGGGGFSGGGSSGSW